MGEIAPSSAKLQGSETPILCRVKGCVVGATRRDACQPRLLTAEGDDAQVTPGRRDSSGDPAIRSRWPLAELEWFRTSRASSQGAVVLSLRLTASPKIPEDGEEAVAAERLPLANTEPLPSVPRPKRSSSASAYVAAPRRATPPPPFNERACLPPGKLKQDKVRLSELSREGGGFKTLCAAAQYAATPEETDTRNGVQTGCPLLAPQPRTVGDTGPPRRSSPSVFPRVLVKIL